MGSNPDNNAGPKIGQRNTSQRNAVLEIMRSLSTFASAGDIHTLLQQQGTSIGLTTVYRALQQLHEAGLVDELQDSTGMTLYRDCDNTHHHHHLICTQCKQTLEISGDAVERWATQTAQEHGFIPTGHTAEVFGICCQCSGSHGTD